MANLDIQQSGQQTGIRQPIEINTWLPARIRNKTPEQRRAARRASRERQRRQEVLGMWRRREAQVQSQINFLTGGRGWDAMSGRHELSYTHVTEYGLSATILTGFWYTNESRAINMFIPGARESAAQKALSAHAVLVNSVRNNIMMNYGQGSGANGRNTPFIPEVYQIEVVEGKTRNFVK